MTGILNWQKLVVLAVFIRLLIMPFYFHPDIKTYNFQVSFLRNGIFDIYTYLGENKKSLPIQEGFAYFPLTYFFLGGYQILAQPVLGEDFRLWLADSSQTANERNNVFRYIFVLKLPYLILDIAIAFLLTYFFSTREQKNKVFKLWLFNPFSILLIYGYSGFDIIPVFFVILGLVMAMKERLFLTALLLGIGAAFKAYPLLFVPVLFIAGKKSLYKILSLLLPVVTFLIIIAPFLKSASFRESAFTSGQMSRLTLIGMSLGFGEMIMIGVMALAVFFYWGALEGRIKSESLWRYYLAVLLLVFSLLHFHIQWLIWILPFMVIVAVSSRRLSLPVFSLFSIAFLIPLLYNDKAMTVGLFSTISPLYNLLPSPFIALQKVYDPYLVQSILHSILAGGSIVIIWQILKEREV